jgi:hypothetical protein
LLDGGVVSADFLVEAFDVLLDLSGDLAAIMLLKPDLLNLADLGKLTAAVEQSAKVLAFLRNGLCPRQRNVCCIVAKHGGVDAIGLGQKPGRPRIVSGLSGSDERALDWHDHGAGLHRGH